MVNNKKANAALRSSAIDLQHLRYAVAAADHGSFRRAADILRVRQSTLSRCVRQLEELIGMAVFERSSGGVRTTPTGSEFLRTARSILEQVDTLMLSAHTTGRGESGRLAIGFYTSLSAANLRATLVDYLFRLHYCVDLYAGRGKVGLRLSADAHHHYKWPSEGCPSADHCRGLH